MKVGIATDHGGFALKEDLITKLLRLKHSDLKLRTLVRRDQ